MIFVIISLSVILIVLLVVLFRIYNRLQSSLSQNIVLSERNTILSQSIENERRQINAEREQLATVFQREREQMSSQFTGQFKALASEILEQKSVTMNALGRESIENLLKPFGQQIELFRKRVEEESRHRFALQQEVGRLAELNMQITRQAQDLTSALKGNSKIQGDWGEMILQTLLESSGLQRDKHFFIQENIKDSSGSNLRPDIILHLPEQKQIIIDSKVSLSSYIDYTQSQTEADRKIHLAKHLLSVRKHIDELGQKGYQRLVSSPDFAIMFVPNEPAFLVALQADNDLWLYAYERNVILSSPTNLFAILRIVEDLWRRDMQSRNAMEIAKQGGSLYDKFVLLLNSFESVGRAIQRSEEAFEETKKHLTGRGNLISRTEKLKQMGAKASKQIPVDMVDDDDESQSIE